MTGGTGTTVITCFSSFYVHAWNRCKVQLRLLSYIFEQARGMSTNGDPERALQHALAADEMKAAVQIVAQRRHDLLNRSDWQRRQSLDGPVSARGDRYVPDLLFDRSLAAIYTEPAREKSLALIQRVEALLPDLPPERAKRLQGEVDARRAALYFLGGDFSRDV